MYNRPSFFWLHTVSDEEIQHKYRHTQKKKKRSWLAIKKFNINIDILVLYQIYIIDYIRDL